MRAKTLASLMLLVAPLVSVADEAEPPSLALLEYLGEWRDEQGNEIDPRVLVLMQLDSTQGGGESDDEE